MFPSHVSALVTLHFLETHPTFAALERAPWDVFQALLRYFQRHDFAYPTQATLARSARVSERTVRSAIAALRLAGIIRPERSRGDDGHERIVYTYGPAALAAFADVEARYPRRASAATIAAPAENDGASPAATIAGELDPKQQKENSSLRPEPEHERVALEALEEHAKRARPEAPFVDTGLVPLVAQRVAEAAAKGDGTIEVQRLAMMGAWLLSRGGPPKPRFVWGCADHFAAHVDRARRKLEGDARAARRSTPALSPSPPRASLAKCGTEPSPAENKRHADDVMAMLERMA